MEIKGVLHCHSTYSYDGQLSLLELKEMFLKQGFRFVCMTEHTDKLTSEQARTFVAECEQLSDDSFLMVPGFEVPYARAHVLMIGARNFCGNFAHTEDELKVWSNDAPFVVLAHPVRNEFIVDEALLAHLDGLEVWNQQYEGKRVPRTRSLQLFDRLRKMKPNLVAVGGLDLHRREHLGSPVITLHVETLSQSAITEKLCAGAFSVSSPYATLYGSLPNAKELIKLYRFESLTSVVVIVFGKFVNKTLKSLGLSLPKSIKERIRKRI